MNKQDYIRQLDEIKAPEELVSKIENIPQNGKTHKKSRWKPIVAAACAVCVLLVGLQNVGGTDKAENKAPLETFTSDGVADDKVVLESTTLTSDSVFGDSSQGDRKIIKTVQFQIETENLDNLTASLNKSMNMYNGFIQDYSEHNYDYNRSVEMTLGIPSDKLDAFIENVKSFAKVTSLQINKSDITNSYIDTQSSIEALEAEEKALLRLLEKAEKLADIISVQDRLTQVRGELESTKKILESYDERIDYSEVKISVSESARVSKSDGSYGSELKEKFTDSIYNLGMFFRNLSLDILGYAPYILIVAVVVLAVILIVKKRKR